MAATVEWESDDSVYKPRPQTMFDFELRYYDIHMDDLSYSIEHLICRFLKQQKTARSIDNIPIYIYTDITDILDFSEWIVATVFPQLNSAFFIMSLLIDFNVVHLCMNIDFVYNQVNIAVVTRRF